jgi:hypothetical protein
MGGTWRSEMPTPASQMALKGLRDLSTLDWYVIPLLALVFYVYASMMIFLYNISKNTHFEALERIVSLSAVS